MSIYTTDIGSRLDKVGGYPELKHSTTRKKDPSSLDLTDFLNLMVVQLQNQSIDSSMDTSDMLNQMVQMEMITALTNMTDASVMSYASSLVGKEVTVAIRDGSKLEEKVIEVMGTGMANGEQVIFSKEGDAYKLSDIMAVGRLPEKEDPEKPGEGTDPEEPGDVEKPGEGGGTEGPGDIENPGENPSEPEDDGPRGEVDPEKDPDAYASAVGK